MSKFLKVFCLALVLSVCLFPASAFATSNYSSSNDKKNLFSNLLSIFSFSSSTNNYNYNDNDSNHDSRKHDDDKNKYDNNWGFDFHDLFDWFDDEDDWWKDIHKWDDYKKDSLKLWEKYYCW